jgi:hypothetical protein
MDQLNNYADTRLLQGCIYCDGFAETRDHVPSKCLLERPFPPNLPVVGCCDSCNQNFSKDEEYFVCLLESVLCGSTDPEKIGRPSVSRILQKSPALRKRIEDSKIEKEGIIAFKPEVNRVENVLLKLAKGHAAFELGHVPIEKPDHFWFGPLSILTQEKQSDFNSVHFQENLGEVGSRGMQRLLVTQMSFQAENGHKKNIQMIFNDWIDVQDDQYRYIAIHDMGMVIIRIVISEYFGCELVWSTS